jgi:HAMP domain-containing protein
MSSADALAVVRADLIERIADSADWAIEDSATVIDTLIELARQTDNLNLANHAHETATAQRDEIRALVATIERLEGERDELRDDLREETEEYDLLTTRQAKLLTDTANALKGDPPPLVIHDWATLPAVAAEVVAERDRLKQVIGALHVAVETFRTGDHQDIIPRVTLADFYNAVSRAYRVAEGITDG